MSISLLIILGVIFGVVSHLGYIDNVKVNLFKNLSNNYFEVNNNREFIGIVMILSYLNVFYVRRCVIKNIVNKM